MWKYLVLARLPRVEVVEVQTRSGCCVVESAEVTTTEASQAGTSQGDLLTQLRVKDTEINVLIISSNICAGVMDWRLL